MSNFNPRSQARTERSYSNQSRRNMRSDYDDDYNYRGGPQTQERDEEGQFISDDDDYRSSRSSGIGRYHSRDDEGRFTSDDDR